MEVLGFFVAVGILLWISGAYILGISFHIYVTSFGKEEWILFTILGIVLFGAWYYLLPLSPFELKTRK